jgi:YbbR domain-containing protein
MNEEMKNHKGLYILLAILVAVCIWVYEDEGGKTGVPNQVETTITDIPVVYAGEERLSERGLMMLEEETTATMDLTISGGRRQLATLSRDNMRVTVSLDGVDEAGIQSVAYSSITSSNRRFSQGMIVMRTPNVVTVNIKELNRKTVEIRCELVGNLADGYNAGELVLSHTSVELQGQAEDINSVSYAKVTLDIGNQAEESITRELEIQYYDANNQLVTSSDIRSVVETVQATLPVFVTKELPLVVEFKEAAGLKVSNLDYQINPATIVVSGDASKLKNVKNIVLGEFDLADILSSNTSSHTYPIIIPENCQNLSGVTRATMEVKFKDMAKAQVETSQFQFLNAPGGKHVEILTQALDVTVFGTSEDVAQTRGEHLIIQVDMENYAAASGTYTVPVQIHENAPGDIGVTGTYQVQVTIREAGESHPDTNPETADPAE